MGKPRGLKDVRKKLEETKNILRQDSEKRKLAIARLKILVGWYEGIRDEDGEWLVEPLCTETARKLFYKGYMEIKEYIKELRN